MIFEEDVFDLDQFVDEFETDEEPVDEEEGVYNYDVMLEEYNESIGYKIDSEEGC